MKFDLIAPMVESPLITIFKNRGFTSVEAIQHYLNTNEKDINDPLALKNMREGAQMLIKHIKEKNIMYVQPDSDVDGFTSAAAFINYLHKLFPWYVENCVFYGMHPRKAHGIEDDLIPEGTKIIVAPDASSNEYDLHKELSERGIDILILDHHQAERESEYACVINNQLCDYPNKELSGVGVVYQFCRYLDSLLGQDYSKDLVDLVATGLIADMVNVTEYETCELIQEGGRRLINPWIKGMMEKNAFAMKGKFTPHSVGWFIAPALNAICRVGTEEEKDIVFQSLLDHRAYVQIPSNKRGRAPGETETTVEQAVRTCTNVRNRQNRDRDAGNEFIDGLIEINHLLDNKILFVRLNSSDVNANIIGLIANQIADKYQRPTLIGANIKGEDGKDYWRGSGRNYAGTEFTNFRAFLLSLGLFEYVEGHDEAFGFSLEVDKTNEFIAASNIALEKYDFSSFYRVDYIFTSINANDRVIKNIASLKDYWGQGLKEPLVAFKGLKISASDLQLFKEKTLKITPHILENIEFVKFGSNPEEFNQLYQEYGSIALDIVGTCEINDYSGNAQITIKDYNISKIWKYNF